MGKTKIVILGAGYGGLMTTVNLQKKLRPEEAEIILVNKHDYHYETTWLHEASAGTRQPEQICYSIRSVINKHVKFIQDSVVEIKANEKKVILGNGEVDYDYLVVALGGEPETFGIKGMKEHAFMIANVDSSRKLQNHIEQQFAAFQNNGSKQELLTIVVGGAGFTGIEFLGELTNKIPELCKKYHVDAKQVKIYCVEAAPMILPGFDAELVEYARKTLENRGVEFKIGTAVKECMEDGVLVAKGEEDPYLIKAKTVIWAAGVRGNQVIEKSKFENIRSRVKVDLYLRVPEHESIFIIGDSSMVINEENNRPFPPTAQIAMQQGQLVAKNIASLIRENDDLEDFVFDNKGTVCSLGENDAIGIVFGKKLKGKLASIMKKVVDNRALVMIGGLSLLFKKGKFHLF